MSPVEAVSIRFQCYLALGSLKSCQCRLDPVQYDDGR